MMSTHRTHSEVLAEYLYRLQAPTPPSLSKSGLASLQRQSQNMRDPPLLVIMLAI
jgi:hypothetical protein